MQVPPKVVINLDQAASQVFRLTFNFDMHILYPFTPYLPLWGGSLEIVK